MDKIITENKNTLHSSFIFPPGNLKKKEMNHIGHQVELSERLLKQTTNNTQASEGCQVEDNQSENIQSIANHKQ